MRPVWGMVARGKITAAGEGGFLIEGILPLVRLGAALLYHSIRMSYTWWKMHALLTLWIFQIVCRHDPWHVDGDYVSPHMAKDRCHRVGL